MTSAPGRVLPAIGLFFLSPLVGEFLLGATSIDMLPLLPVQALLYGGGTLLIREVVRRARRGWWSILLLGAAYALVEEGLLDQLLFNPHYADSYDMVTVTYVPFLGTGVYGLLSVLAVHAVWSVTVPIALVEALVPERSGEPWLGRVGLSLTMASFLLGTVVVGWGTFAEQHFIAPWTRLSGTALIVIILIVAAFRIRRPRQATAGRPARRPPLVAATAFVLTSLFMLVLQPDRWGVAAALAVAAVAVTVGLRGCGPARRRRRTGASGAGGEDDGVVADDAEGMSASRRIRRPSVEQLDDLGRVIDLAQRKQDVAEAPRHPVAW